RDEQVPDHRAQSLSVWCDPLRKERGNQHARVSLLPCEAAVAANYAEYPSADFLCELDGLYQVHRHNPIATATADREYKYSVAVPRRGAAQPGRDACIPALVVDTGGECGNVVCGGVSLEATELAEVVHGVAGMPR